MKNTKIALGVAAAACVLASPAFAAKTSLGDADLGKVTGKSNVYNFGSATSSMTVENMSDTSANINFGMYQWSDTHDADNSDHKGANNQSGATSNVQANISVTVNSLAWGGLGQNNLTNTAAVTLSGGEVNMAYGVFAGGGF